MIAYLACPYSHSDPAVRLARFEAANRAASRLMLAGEMVFSPISQNHPIIAAGGLPCGWDFWEPYDRAILAICGKVYVLTVDGWDTSKGVGAELRIALELGIPCDFLESEP
jgi:hypothetical protein